MSGKRRAQTTERRRNCSPSSVEDCTAKLAKAQLLLLPRVYALLSDQCRYGQYVCSCKTISLHCRRTMLTHPLTYARTHSINLSLVHSLTRLVLHHSLNRSFTHSFIHSLTHSFTHTLVHSLTNSFNHPPTYSLSHLLIQSVLYAVNIFSRFFYYTR